MGTLQESGLLVNLTISHWRGSKLDKKVTKEIEDLHQTNKSGRYTKDLVTNEDLREINKAYTAIREFHISNTLPWDNSGARLLPAANYFTYVEKLGKLKMDYDNAVQAFITNWDFILASARIRLNGLFNIHDYPTVSELKDKFGVVSVMLPVPDADFRVSLTEAERDQLKKQAEQEIQNRMDYAQKENWNRIHEQLLRMKTIFETDGKVFESLFDSLVDLINILPKFNITNDVKILEVCEELKQLVVDPKDVRKHKEVRSEKANQVDQILAKFGMMF